MTGSLEKFIENGIAWLARKKDKIKVGSHFKFSHQKYKESKEGEVRTQRGRRKKNEHREEKEIEKEAKRQRKGRRQEGGRGNYIKRNKKRNGHKKGGRDMEVEEIVRVKNVEGKEKWKRTHKEKGGRLKS